MQADATARAGRPFAIVLGLNEVASAVAVNLYNAGYAVVMARDPTGPVIRRGMAFFDALFDDEVTLGGVTAVCVDSVLTARLQVREHEHILVTRLDLSELLIIGDVDALIDARLHSDAVKPRLSELARFTIGIGNGFVSGKNCDAVIAARCSGAARDHGREPPRERVLVMRAPAAGHWHTPVDIGMRVYKRFTLGHLGSTTITAPVDGVLRGIARDGTDVSSGSELIEISTTSGGGRWWGLNAQGARVGEEILRALERLGAEDAVPSGKALRLVHSR